MCPIERWKKLWSWTKGIFIQRAHAFPKMDKPMQRRTGIDEKRNRHENKRDLHCGGWKNQL